MQVLDGKLSFSSDDLELVFKILLSMDSVCFYCLCQREASVDVQSAVE